MDHHTGLVLAYVFGRRQGKVFPQLQGLLESLGITCYRTDCVSALIASNTCGDLTATATARRTGDSFVPTATGKSTAMG